MQHLAPQKSIFTTENNRTDMKKPPESLMLLGGFSIFSSIVRTAFAGKMWSAGDREAYRVLGAEQCFGLRVYIGLPSILLRSCVISRGVASGFFSRNSSTPSASSVVVIIPTKSYT